jgi:DNA-binding response OmpR family regulator
MARILLVDDDEPLLEVMGRALQDATYDVVCVSDGKDGFDKATGGAFDLVVSDVNMPRLDGFTLCRRLRERGVTVPIVLLTARDDEVDQALGLELGADDYVVKPMSNRVLVAKVAALLRREQYRTRGPGPVAEPVVSHGKLRLALDRMVARYDGVEVETTLTEFRLLTVLIGAPGVVFTREQLLERVRDDNRVVNSRLVDTYVRRIRRKLEAIDAGFDGIETVLGLGYSWRDR